MINLQEVTLWSIVCSPDGRLIHRTILVMEWMRKHFAFGDCVLFCCESPSLSGIRVEVCPEMDLTNLNVFVIREVPGRITTKFAMSVHEDGFAVNPELWSQDFLAFDYIGAPWPDGVVGNGGFCIESKRFMDAKKSLSSEGLFGEWSENGTVVSGTTPSDVFVCRKRRAELESSGMTWAPVDVAARFSTEQTHKHLPSFGFHGRIAAQDKYRLGWALIDA